MFPNFFLFLCLTYSVIFIILRINITDEGFIFREFFDEKSCAFFGIVGADTKAKFTKCFYVTTAKFKMNYATYHNTTIFDK